MADVDLKVRSLPMERSIRRGLPFLCTPSRVHRGVATPRRYDYLDSRLKERDLSSRQRIELKTLRKITNLGKSSAGRHATGSILQTTYCNCRIRRLAAPSASP